MDAKMKYTIEFLYTDNNQLYQEDVELTDAEYKRVNAFLTKLERAGSIELTVEGGSVITHTVSPRSSASRSSRRIGRLAHCSTGERSTACACEPLRSRRRLAVCHI